MESHVFDEIDLEYYRRLADCLYLHKALCAEYLNLVHGLTNSTSQVRVLKDVRPLQLLCDLEEGIPWVQENRELASGMNTDKINKLLRQREVLKVTGPVVFKDSEGNFHLDSARV